MEDMGRREWKTFILFLSLCPVSKEDKNVHFQFKVESISVQFKVLNYVSVEMGFVRIAPLDTELVLS